MRRPLAYTAIAVLVSASSAFAASHYYVVQKAGGGACSVTTKKPDGTKVMMIGNGYYKTKADADAALRISAECLKK